jgi:hypothetical protein
MPGPFSFTEVTFTLEGQDFSCPVTRAEFTAQAKLLQSVTLCGVRGATGRSTYQLELEGEQDWFEGVDSLCGYLEDHEGEKAEVTVDWTASDGSGRVTKTATVTLVAPSFGGTADELGTFSITMPADGKPVRVILASE